MGYGGVLSVRWGVAVCCKPQRADGSQWVVEVKTLRPLNDAERYYVTEL